MERELVDKMRLVLNLKRRIVGVKFIFIEEEYNDYKMEVYPFKGAVCGIVAQALKGNTYKAKCESFSCTGGRECLGLTSVASYVRAGKRFDEFRLYEDLAISRQVQEDLCYLDQKIYGLVAGPLEELEDSDVVLYLCDGWQMMRTIQGYTYHHGMAKNIGMIGNQGICSDLIARPFYKNDLNISCLCAGARTSTKAEDWEIGVGMPIHLFRDIAKGILITLNPATNEIKKKELKERMDQQDKYHFDIEFGKMYGSYSKKKKYPKELYEKELF